MPLIFELDYDRVHHWRANATCHWLRKCGFDEKYCKAFLDNNINGVFLLSLTMDVLTNDLSIEEDVANDMYKCIRSLRRYVGFTHEDDSAVIELIKEKISQYETELERLRNIEYKASESLNEFRTKQKAKEAENKQLKEYEIKMKCIQMSKNGASKKHISTKLKKPMQWVNKYYNKNPNTFKKPQICKCTKCFRITMTFLIVWFIGVIIFFYKFTYSATSGDDNLFA